MHIANCQMGITKELSCHMHDTKYDGLSPPTQGQADVLTLFRTSIGMNSGDEC